MTNPYPEFDDSEHNDEDDEAIGALGSILSWDEHEDGGGGINNSTSDPKASSLQPTALPNIVTFNLKGGGVNSFQQLEENDGDLSTTMPTQINYDQTQPSIATNQTGQAQQQQEMGNVSTNGMAHQFTMNQQVTNTTPQQQEQIPQPQQQIQQHQQFQLHSNHHSQIGSTNVPQQQQQQQQQQQPQMFQQALSQPAMGAAMATFPFYQQNAPAVQQQNAQALPTMMISNASQTGQQMSGQQDPSQLPFGADPNTLLRQLQVAQLQQQFNSFQQARTVQQQVAAPQVQVALQAQAQMAQASQVAASQPPPASGRVAAAPTKMDRPPVEKIPPASQQISKPRQSKPSSNTKAPIVSASDTDGEISKVDSVGSKGTKSTTSGKKSEIDTSNMSSAEKAAANRDRNREHARNTRLRKKAYLEKLKSTVDELCRERDCLVSERAGAANILVDMHNTRTEVLMSFFALRSANEKRRELWSSILDESCFACVVPVTPYRSFPASEVQVSKCQRTILGIDGMMSDTASLHVLLNSLVDRARFPNASIMFRYTLVTEEAVVAGNQMMARWVMSTINATQCGARMEVSKHGMLCCKFNSAHKIIGIELMFDVMALMLQLKQAAGVDTFSVIPNTVQTCQRTFDKPMVMALADEPYTIVQVNKLWESLTGYKAEDVVGKVSTRILEGEQTDSAAANVLTNEMRFKRPASAMMVNYKKSGELFRNFFHVYPLSTDSRITHYLYLSSYVDSNVPVKGTNPLRAPVGQNPQAAPFVQGMVPTAPPYFSGVQKPGQVSMVPSAPQQLLGLASLPSNTVVGSTAQPAALHQGLAVSKHQNSLGASKRPLENPTGIVSPNKHAKTANK